MTCRLARLVLTVLMLATSLASTAFSADKLKALIVDGQNNHNWPATTPLLKLALEECGKFEVEVATSPASGQDQADFAPKFSDYDVVVSNYNGDLWSAATQRALVDYVRAGGGLVVVHAANNSFPQWPEYNDMIGLGWRDANFGDRITYDDEGQPVRTPKGEGPGAGHGSQHPFVVKVRDAEHPVTQGMPAEWLHVSDELYHGQRGPAQNMRILATAFATKESGGTGTHEPMIWDIPYGKGRVLTTVMGHSPESMKCIGFIVTLQRGAEYAATGKVADDKLPENFPSKEETQTRE
ncbi:MAG: ThuA domain-containing protein [Pirellulales bacterium]